MKPSNLIKLTKIIATEFLGVKVNVIMFSMILASLCKESRVTLFSKSIQQANILVYLWNGMKGQKVDVCGFISFVVVS